MGAWKTAKSSVYSLLIHSIRGWKETIRTGEWSIAATTWQLRASNLRLQRGSWICEILPDDIKRVPIWMLCTHFKHLWNASMFGIHIIIIKTWINALFSFDDTIGRCILWRRLDPCTVRSLVFGKHFISGDMQKHWKRWEFLLKTVSRARSNKKHPIPLLLNLLSNYYYYNLSRKQKLTLSHFFCTDKLSWLWHWVCAIKATYIGSVWSDLHVKNVHYIPICSAWRRRKFAIVVGSCYPPIATNTETDCGWIVRGWCTDCAH